MRGIGLAWFLDAAFVAKPDWWRDWWILVVAMFVLVGLAFLVEWIDRTERHDKEQHPDIDLQIRPKIKELDGPGEFLYELELRRAPPGTYRPWREQFHVYYRTQGMANRSESGWKRADVMAETADEALHAIADTKRLIFARVYPGSACTAWKVDWTPEYVLRHEPHQGLVEE